MKYSTIKIFCMKFFTNSNSKYIIATLRIVIIGKPELTFFFLSLREKCPHSELFWSALFLIGIEYGKIWEMRENTDYNNFIFRYFYAVYNSMRKWIKKKDDSINCSSQNFDEKFLFFLVFLLRHVTRPASLLTKINT